MAEERDDQGRQSEFAQQGQQSQAERQQAGQQPFAAPQASNEDGSSDEGAQSETLLQAGSSQDSLNQNAGGASNFSDTDQQGSGFIGAQGTGSDDYLQDRNPELAQQDSLNQQNDDGMGSPASEQDS